MTTTTEHDTSDAQPAPEGHPVPAPRIVVGVSDSESGLAALGYAMREARTRGAAVHLVRVWRDIGWLFSATAAGIMGLRERERADGLLLALATEAAHAVAPDVHVIPEFVPGNLYTELQRRAEGADLLVIGWGDDDDPAGHVIANWLEEHAPCPVVVVAPEEPPGATASSSAPSALVATR
jgi:hypothetical protein